MSDSLKSIKKLIVGLFEFYGEPLTETRLNIYVGVLGGMTPEELTYAMNQVFRNPAQVRLPLPAVLLEQINPTQSVESAANELIGRVVMAISAYGYIDPLGAREYLGDDVWSALPGEVGWLELCSSQSNDGTVRAQLRERISSRLRQKNTNGRVMLAPPGTPKIKLFVPFKEPEKEVITLEPLAKLLKL